MSAEFYSGLGTSLAASAVTNSLALVALLKNVDDVVVLMVVNILFGNILSFVLDIVFAKETCVAPGGCGGLSSRAALSLRALASPAFARYMAISVVDAAVVYCLYFTMKHYAEKWGVLSKYPALRSVTIAAISTSITFVLYVNQARFGWALADL